MKILVCAAFAAIALMAAPPDPVSWKLEPPVAKSIKAGTRLNVKLVATIQPGWHLYSLKPIAEGPIPTRIWIAEGQPFTLASSVQAPEPTLAQDKTIGMEVEFYEGETAFTVPVKIVAGTSGAQ